MTLNRFEFGSPNSWIGYKDQGRRFYEEGRYAQALESYQKAMDFDHHISRQDRQLLLSNVVACRLQLGQAEAAIDDAKACVALNPSWAKGHVRLASAYIAARNQQQQQGATSRSNGRSYSNDACNSLQTALRIDPGNAVARQMLVKELRRDYHRPPEVVSSTNDGIDLDGNQFSNDGTDAARPPLENPDYQASSHNQFQPGQSQSSQRSGSRGDNTTASTDPLLDPVENDVTLMDRIRFYWGSARDWYRNQSTTVQNALQLAAVLVALYVAFGGRFGLEYVGSTSVLEPSPQSFDRSVFEAGRRPSDGGRNLNNDHVYSSPTHRRGNPEIRNAYDEYYHQRNNPIDYHDDRWRDVQSRWERRYGHRGGGIGLRFLGNLPAMAMIAGIAYFAHRNGFDPLHAVLVAIMMGRRGYGGFGGGAWGGRGMHRRRRW